MYSAACRSDGVPAARGAIVPARCCTCENATSADGATCAPAGPGGIPPANTRVRNVAAKSRAIDIAAPLLSYPYVRLPRLAGFVAATAAGPDPLPDRR